MSPIKSLKCSGGSGDLWLSCDSLHNCSMGTDEIPSQLFCKIPLWFPTMIQSVAVFYFFFDGKGGESCLTLHPFLSEHMKSPSSFPPTGKMSHPPDLSLTFLFAFVFISFQDALIYSLKKAHPRESAGFRVTSTASVHWGSPTWMIHVGLGHFAKKS